MLYVVINLLLLLFLGLAGLTCGWCLRKVRVAGATNYDTEDEVRLVQKAIGRLQTWIARLTAVVGKHRRRMERLHHEFADDGDHETTAVVQTTAKLIRADEQFQQGLTKAGAKLQEHAQQIGEDPH
jgi:hypothetical protein